MDIDPFTFLVPVAYIGPGAGIAFVGSFLLFCCTLVLGILLLLALPVRWMLRFLFSGSRRRGKFKRCVIIGFDGMDPDRARELMDAGVLPHLSRLRKEGSFMPLRSTCPPVSPVAWSSFATGTNPGKHGVFDFVARDPDTYRLTLSTSRIRDTAARCGWLGRFAPGPRHELLRMSRPFWELLGRHGVFCTVLRVPVTFPFEAFRGLGLSGMCVPDIRGTQGEFTLFESTPSSTDPPSSGIRIMVRPAKGRVYCDLPGSRSGNPGTRVRLTIRIRTPQEATLLLHHRQHRLQVGVYTPWLRVCFRSGWKRTYGICRILPLSLAPDFRLYITPVHPDPLHPSLPLAHPLAYSIYLAKRFGAFATLGLAEDTDARNQGVIDDKAFLTQCHDFQEERERIFEDALEHTRRGCCIGVFDLTDRVQHMYEGDSSGKAKGTGAQDVKANDTVKCAYQRCDDLIGRVLGKIGPDTLLLVLSDHGFGAFRREVSLNAWLQEQGYLVTVPSASAPDTPFGTVDWSRTRAYALGLAGIYLNIKGRECRGTVSPGAPAKTLADEIRQRLLALADPQHQVHPVLQVHLNSEVWNGPYLERGPDLAVGFRRGYRVSWKSAAGHIDEGVFLDNRKAWSGDHCFDRDEVPGVLFCNRVLDTGGHPPDITDIAPTLLESWGVPVPPHMDGIPMKIA